MTNPDDEIIFENPRDLLNWYREQGRNEEADHIATLLAAADDGPSLTWGYDPKDTDEWDG